MIQLLSNCYKPYYKYKWNIYIYIYIHNTKSGLRLIMRNIKLELFNLYDQ